MDHCEPSPMELMVMSNNSVLKMESRYEPVQTADDMEADTTALSDHVQSDSDSDWGWSEGEEERDDEMSHWMTSLRLEESQRETKSSLRLSRFMTFALCLVMSNAFAGLNPVFNRLLQFGSEKVPPFTYGTMVHGLALLLYAPRMLWKIRRATRHNPQLLSRNVVGSLSLSAIRSWVTYVFVVSVVMRSFAAYVAASFTEAAFVALVDMMAPLVIAFLGYVFFRQSSLMTWKFAAIIMCSVLGSLLVVVGGKSQGWHFGELLAWRDLAGVALSAVSMLSLSIRAVITHYITSQSAGSDDALVKDLTTDPEVAFFATKLAQFATFMPLMFLLEDIDFLWTLSMRSWGLLLLSSIVVHLIAVILRIEASKHLSVTSVGALLPVQFISSVTFGAILLQEYVTILEMVGIAVICLSASVFVILRRNAERHQSDSITHTHALLPMDDPDHDEYNFALDVDVGPLGSTAPVKEQVIVMHKVATERSSSSIA